MSWVTQFLGIDQANAQQSAIAKQQQIADQQYGAAQGIYNTSLGGFEGASANEIAAARAGAANLVGETAAEGTQLMAMGQRLGGQYNQAARQEFRGALDDIFRAGRSQASRSGLIGGYQEALGTTPAIAALGRSFATRQQDILRENMMSQIGLGKQVFGTMANARGQALTATLSPYARATQGRAAITQQALANMGSAGQQRLDSYGNYAEPPNPLGSLLGGLGGLAGGAGSFFSGGKAIGLF